MEFGALGVLVFVMVGGMLLIERKIPRSSTGGGGILKRGNRILKGGNRIHLIRKSRLLDLSLSKLSIFNKIPYDAGSTIMIMMIVFLCMIPMSISVQEEPGQVME